MFCSWKCALSNSALCICCIFHVNKQEVLFLEWLMHKHFVEWKEKRVTHWFLGSRWRILRSRYDFPMISLGIVSFAGVGNILFVFSWGWVQCSCLYNTVASQHHTTKFMCAMHHFNYPVLTLWTSRPSFENRMKWTSLLHRHRSRIPIKSNAII